MAVASVSSRLSPVQAEATRLSSSRQTEQRLEVFETQATRASDKFELRQAQAIRIERPPSQRSFIRRIAQPLRPYMVPPSAHGKKIILLTALTVSGGVCFSMGVFSGLVSLLCTMLFAVFVEKFSEAEQ
jgi:hypothetical protein